MAREFRVTSGVRPGRVDVTWTDEVAGTDRPSFRLLRRRAGFPADAADGFTVTDVDDLFRAPAAPWPRIERVACVGTNSGAEGGLLQASLELYFLAADAAEPARGVVAVYDPATGTLERTSLEELSRVTHAAGPASPPYTQVQVWEIFATPGGGPEVSLGTVTFFEFTPDPLAPPPLPSRFRWTPAAGPVREADYHERRFEAIAGSGGAQEASFLTTPGPHLAIHAKSNPDAGTTAWTFEVQDGDLEPGVEYYYRLFGAGGASVPEPARGSALATGVYGAHDVMYGLLPPVHQVVDVDAAAPNGGKALYRFLAAFGLAVDHFRGQVDGVAARHDIAAARADMLPHLARMIGWLPDLTAPENTQRQDIRCAPEVFGAVGTLRNAPDLVNRVTSWPTRVKEFVHNVFLTNAPEPIPIWEIWQVTRGGGGTWTTPAPLALATSMDGRPVALEAGGMPWVIWHSDRGGRRELWFQRLGVDVAARRVMDGAPDDAPGLTYADETPAAIVEGSDVRLYWTSDRDGTPRIWTRLMSPAPGLAERVTEHVQADLHPAVIADGADTLLFWDSERRGPRDLWYQRRTGVTWGPPVRVVKDAAYDTLRDGFPAAVRAPGGDLWLFWCRDRGDRREIWHQVVSGGVWGPQQSLSADLVGGGRDEAPCPVVVGGRVWLLFHSNRGGPWQIWTRVHDGTAWQAPPTRLSDERTAESEPTAFVDGGDLRVFWTSQRRTRWYRSRTLDFNDAGMLAEMGTFHDHAHYVYDCGEGADDWYSRHSVGLYVTPDVVDAGLVDAAVQRAGAFLEPFRAAPVRYVWPLGDLAHEETIEVGGVAGETWSDDV